MKYTYSNGKSFNIPNEEIDKLMEKADLSIAEACELWLSDHELIIDETVEKLTKNAQKNRITATIHEAKGEKKARKPREKKENPTKRQIIAILYDAINKNFATNKPIEIENPEKFINFSFEDNDYTINLVCHRKKKES